MTDLCCNSVQIIQTAQKSFYARLFYSKTGEPFDLTSVTEIVALLPGANGVPVKKTFSNSGGITVVGANGAGKIQIALSTVDTSLLNANPQIKQDLQVVATISGVAQIDTLSFGSPPTQNTAYNVTLNGEEFSYTAKVTDTAQDVFNALKTLIAQAGLPLTPVVSGSGNMATLVLTSTIAGLAFSDVVSNGITLTPTTANGGTRTIFLIQSVLDIQPENFSGA